jgi:hypothetical protein
VQLICSDLTTMWCELTSSIRTRTHNDEDKELGIFDRNPTVATHALHEQPLEKEILLCFRPVLQGAIIEEDLRFGHQATLTRNFN